MFFSLERPAAYIGLCSAGLHERQPGAEGGGADRATGAPRWARTAVPAFRPWLGPADPEIRAFPQGRAHSLGPRGS